MNLVLLITVVALLCIGAGIMFLYSVKNGFVKARFWKLTPQEQVIVNVGVVCTGTAFALLWLGGYLT